MNIKLLLVTRGSLSRHFVLVVLEIYIFAQLVLMQRLD
jgi:hypothetical protein